MFPASPLRTVLNVGSGPANPLKLHAAFRREGWREVRLDIDPAVNPDILGSTADMRGFLADGSVDAVWSSHNIEHLAAHEVPGALAEMVRVLKDGGFALITCPDVEAVAAMIVEKGLDAIAYQSPAGPVTPLDMLWGHGASVAAGHAHMAHRTGFTVQRLARLALAAGFAEVRLAKGVLDLWALCLKPGCDPAALAPLFENTAQASLLAAGPEEAEDPGPPA